MTVRSPDQAFQSTGGGGGVGSEEGVEESWADRIKH